MLELWLNFLIIIIVQISLLIVHAFYVKKIIDVPRLLRESFFVGIVVGLTFDLFVGKYFGFYSYTFGFSAYFLTVNAIVSYGIFAAHVLLVHHSNLVHLFAWLITVVVMYEFTNYLFPVWSWQFANSEIEFAAVLLLGYSAGGVFSSLVWQALYKNSYFLTKTID